MPEMRGPQDAPAEDRPVYQPGDVVWVKLPSFPWWPAQVIPAEENRSHLQSMVALVKTFQDNCMIPITKANKIAPFEDPRKEDWIKRGQLERRATLQSMFLPAVRQAEAELQEANVAKEEEMEHQESQGACENRSGVAASPSGKRRRRGSGRTVGRGRPRREKSQGPLDPNRSTPELFPPPPPPLPPSPPPSDKDFVRHEIHIFDFDDLPRITPPTKIRSPHWSRKFQKSELETVGVKELETVRGKELETVGVKDLMSEKDSVQTNDQETHGVECVESSSRADTCDGTAAGGDPATAEAIERSGCPSRVLSEFQDEKAAARGGESESSEPGCDTVADEGSDEGGLGVEVISISESCSETLSLPVTPVKNASLQSPQYLNCSPVLSNCSEGIPFPMSPLDQDENEDVNDMDTQEDVNDMDTHESPINSASSSSSSSGIITFPKLDRGRNCSSNRTAASSSKSDGGGKCAFKRARDKLLMDSTTKAEEVCVLESEEALVESDQTTSNQEERSPVQNADETPPGVVVDDEPVCESQSLPLPVTPEKRKRGRRRLNRRVTKRAKPCTAAKLETNPVEAEGSRACPVVTSSSSVEDRTDERGREDSNADSDSESDLPDVLKLTPDEMKYPQENSVVWVKFQRYPFWPSMVQKVVKVRKRIKKIKVTFLGEGPRSFLVNYTKKNVIFPFFGPHCQKLVDVGREALKDKGEVAMKNFNDAVHQAYQHRNAEMYKAFNCTELEPMDTEAIEDVPAKTKAEEVEARKAGAPPKQANKKTAAKRTAPSQRAMALLRPASLQKKVALQRTAAAAGQTTRARVPRPISRTQQERRQRAMMIRRQKKLKKLIANKAERKKKNKKIVDFIKSEATAEHLKNIFHGKIPSERHTMYLEGIRQRDMLRYAGFGPIDDEDQQQEILQHLTTIFKECYHKLGHETYVLDVWVPEAVVLSLRKTRRQAPKKAWDMFRRGVPLLQVEQELIHEEISANIKRLKSDDPAPAEVVVEIPDN